MTIAPGQSDDRRPISSLIAAADRLLVGPDPVETSLADTVAPADDAEPSRPPSAAGKQRPTPDAAPTQPGSRKAAADRDELRRGSSIDRFLVLDRLGFGGMGVVVSAYDPELDRRVAIKVLRNDLFRAEQPTAGRQRLQREARAMARLSHPNVVAVYEIGRLNDRLYVVMEYVDGRTVTRWLDERKRDWREIVDVFVRAGRGLAAAHEAGMVHRDFKPDNVLVGKSGRVRVTDFGLVSATGQEIDAGSLEGEIQPSALESSLTCTGAILGTPVYMAPEQHAGEPADPRTDQFSFCVALYEALYRERPFVGATYEEIAARVQAGEVREPPRDSEVPSWLRQLLLRGLARDPADRYPSMTELLTDLERDPDAHRRRARIGIAAAAGLAILVGLSALGLLHKSSASAPLCRDAAGQLAGVWDDQIAARVETAFTATGLPYAASSLAGARKLLDDYAEKWVAMRTEACEATHIHGTQSAELLDLRMMCLDERRTALGALTDLLARADADVVEDAVDAVNDLPSISRCADARALRQLAPLPEDPASRARIGELRRQVAEANVLLHAGKYEDGLAISKVAYNALGDVHYRPLEADVLRVHGALVQYSGNPRDAADLLIDAEIAALAGRYDEGAIRAATQLVWTVGYRLGDPKQGERWGRTAAALLEGSGDRNLGGELESNLAVLEIIRGNYEPALVHAKRAVELRRERYGDDSSVTASAYNQLGVALKRLGRLDEAMTAYQHTLAVNRATLGEDHPMTAMALHNIGVVEKRMGQSEQAERDLQAALDRWQKVLPADHQNIGMALLNLGVNEVELDRLDDAETHLQRALEIKRARLGPDHPSVATVAQALAGVARARGDLSKALELIQPVVPALTEKLGDDHPSVANALRDLGRIQLDLGNLDAAHAAASRALEIRRARLPAGHQEIVMSLCDVGRIELARARPARALAPLREATGAMESAVAEHPEVSTNVSLLASARFLLGRALWESGQDRAQGRQLVEQAATALSGSTEAELREHADQANRWLAEHDRTR